ncbi:hypothetical protein DID88_009841 [Monilinia fructigena]|uniref:DUF6594 domain-containing protein n=1 Tax=Monilinia fructigena TaxID=38457 RepID=A0A395IKF5_9HELO|nr:hypothetical protein DID88_009841 [Monilinia fructigena]
MAKKSRGLAIQPSQPSEPASPATTSQSNDTVVASPTSQLQFTSGPWEKDTDPFEDLEKPLPGWPLVSKLIAKYPDLEAFKAFRDLNIKSLLYYQAELQNLQMKLHRAEYNEYRMGEQECKSKQVKIMKQIRVVLKDYNDALLQYSQIAALPNADPYNVETLRVWLKRVGNHCISGPAALPRQGQKVDSLTRWVANELYNAALRIFLCMLQIEFPAKKDEETVQLGPGTISDASNAISLQ